MNLQKLLADAAVAIVGVLIAVALGYWWGATASRDAVAADQARAQGQAVQAYQAEVRRADLATDRYLTDQRDLEDRYAALDRSHQDLLRRHGVLVARPAVAGAAVRRCAADVGGELLARAQPGGQPGPADAAPAPGRGELPDGDGGDGAGDVELNLAAVRVWNASLAGRDAPAGACGAAAAAEGPDAACAAGSGLTLVDAWANHHANARACAEDRQRYRHLIEFLTRTPTPER